MSEGDPDSDARDERQATRHPWRALAMFAMTALLGPPIGALVVLVPLFLGLATSAPSYTADYASLVSNIVVVGYTVGGIRAALAGLWVGYIVWRSGRVGYGQCVLAALAATAAAIVYLGIVAGPEGWLAGALVNVLPAMGAIVAAVGCRWIAGACGILLR